ncbi:DUF4157 domain-containing protein [Kitasatospora sp. NPDC096140]|uniref:eCIS core domain-containing protein n=1 Tax=Kitasatospora sp. NPDC096140 TaxID=3155425 RepID=UPI00331D5FFE
MQRTIGNAAVTRLVQQRRATGGNADQDELPLQRSLVHQVLRTAGRPLDGSTRRDMESRLGADFSDVRLHTGSTADASAAEIGARAFTSGNHVVLGAGGGDRHTLAHELTHVIQQRRGPVAGTDRGDGLRVSDPSDRYEREAEANAVRALSAPPARSDGPAAESVTGTSPAAQAREAVQRMPPKRKSGTTDTAVGEAEPSGGGRRTRAKIRAENLDLNRPTLEFRSNYEGPATQKLHSSQEIGFQQVARLKNPPGAPQRVSSNYHFWQEVSDSNVQIIESESGYGEHPSARGWVQDGPYRPTYTDAVITDNQDKIEFNDNPGFSTTARMTSGYWLKAYSVSFRWKVALNTGGRWNRNLPAWTSPEVTHTLVSEFDPENPDKEAPINAVRAGDFDWNVDLSALGDGS